LPIDIQYIKGIGPQRAEGLKKSGINTALDALYYYPISYIDRSARLLIKDAILGLKKRNYISAVDPDSDFIFNKEITIIGKVYEIKTKVYAGNKSLVSIYLKDETGNASVNFWHFNQYIASKYRNGMLVVISGKPTLNKFNVLEFNHPEMDIITPEEEELFDLGVILPKYSIDKNMAKVKINQLLLRRIIEYSLKNEVNSLKETLPDYIIEKYNFPNIKHTVYSLHFPKDINNLYAAQNRIKFEELFFYSLRIAVRKFNYAKLGSGVVINQKSITARELYNKLPYELTSDQKRALNEIALDLKSGKPMHRLLQGDVGSGKTIVSLLAMLMAVDMGYQTAIMAPTELLAEQHFLTIKKFMSGIDINIVQLVGGQKNKARLAILNDIKEGKANIIVGTHALFQEVVEYKKLGFIVIDEQHRFGVEQKSKLANMASKSLGADTSDIKPHILVTTATPIPRSLMMTVTGDLDVSTIKSKPKNRKPINTRIAFESEREQIYSFIRKTVEKKNQVYLVYPLIEDTDSSIEKDIKSAENHFEELSKSIFSDFKCAMLHGRMLWYEKEEIMQDFAAGKFDILIATTVVEVGIDIANATLMVVENAERFGLSQLHQLRGRVGRSDLQSYCILMVNEKFKHPMEITNNSADNQIAIMRLKAMEETSDGFRISEIDLKLRGPGDVIGKEQTGLPKFKYADIVNDIDILTMAKDLAFTIIAQDPTLSFPQHRILKDRMSLIDEISGKTFDIA